MPPRGVHELHGEYGHHVYTEEPCVCESDVPIAARTAYRRLMDWIGDMPHAADLLPVPAGVKHLEIAGVRCLYTFSVRHDRFLVRIDTLLHP